MFQGSCDLCTKPQKTLINLSGETANILNETYGLKIAVPMKWRICYSCDFELSKIVNYYVGRIGVRVGIPKCFICGIIHVVPRTPTFTKQLKELHQLKIPAPNDSGKLHSCFSCLHVIETCIKYGKFLKNSMLKSEAVPVYVVQPQQGPSYVRLPSKRKTMEVHLPKKKLKTVVQLDTSSDASSDASSDTLSDTSSDTSDPPTPIMLKRLKPAPKSVKRNIIKNLKSKKN